MIHCAFSNKKAAWNLKLFMFQAALGIAAF